MVSEKPKHIYEYVKGDIEVQNYICLCNIRRVADYEYRQSINFLVTNWQQISLLKYKLVPRAMRFVKNIYTRLVIPTSVTVNLPLVNAKRILSLVVYNHGCVEVRVKATPHHPRPLSPFHHRVCLTVKHQLHFCVASEGIAVVQKGEGT